MTTTSTPTFIPASLPGAVSNHHSIGQFSYCWRCADPAGFLSPALVYPYFPSQPLICQHCGRIDYDLSGYCVVREACNSIVSPIFPTAGEARRFGEIFGATKQSGFAIWCYQSFFYEDDIDSEGRKDWLSDLEQGRAIYERILAEFPTNPTHDELIAFALSLRIEPYALPIFGPSATRAA